ncbi:restriction endonuclease subunit S [Bacteroides ovatus]|uniref:restriction endonuclease subunit S n=1 Tax=Bacteroides ovatus TaxID=28116 RepID=UPI0012312E0C|nr:restriction endonuclease subunit S [Bacteroides ovatus]KAA3836128.1 restriction endonuclease subunit S [Bacteroides ovatus]KAA3871351.1 restriction endonuclease subunit S [Bacteroides ovatus]MBT9934176.1 restriction endonuclease subunit S [Bacteroides ovatus]MCE8798239.1 restriction endonuclease subunit S [Bacteroides ovatus]MDC2487888.1 restriction endonuclease subunit S [Bacteroides ovatus]
MATFGDIAKGFDYGMNAAAKSFDGNNKYIRITDIDEVSSQYLYDDVVSPDGELEDRYLVKENDILLARTGASTGKSYLYRNSDGKLYFAGFLIRANIYKHNSYFVFSQLHTLRYKKWISVMSARSGQPGINSQEYASFPVYTTSLQEEDKIATFLKLLDERIITQNKIIEKYESLIKGIAQNVARNNKPNIRLSECLECSSSTLQESDVCENGTYPVYGANGIVGYLDNYNAEKEAVYIIKDGSGVGTVSYVTGKCSATGTLNTLQAKEGYSLQYLYYMLKVFNFEPYKTGMAIPHIYFKDYGKAKIFCPSYTEQLKYVGVLSTIDNKLSAEQSILTDLSLQKQYLLHQMFI